MGDPKQFEVSATPDGEVAWSQIDWASTIKAVERLQVRIAKAAREERWGKVRSLQRLLVRSLPARRLAVRRVTTNQGKRTPGIDGVLWNTPRQKMRAVGELKRRGYQPQPLRRIHIPKRSGGKRPLSIPCMKDRAMQALHLLALEPVAEQKADPNSYGFRKARSIQDAHQQCYHVLSRGNCASWVFDADIKACFDHISHEWLLDNIPMDKSILHKWLKAGYLEGNLFHSTEKGTPQGGIISPTLATLTLDGLEDHVRASVPLPKRGELYPRVNLIRYADDLVATARTREILEETVIPAIAAFLEPRGLRLSEEKSKIVHIDEGFDFLGANVRKYNGKLRIGPITANMKSILRATRDTLRRNRGAATDVVLRKLNSILRGWAFQFRHLSAKKTFKTVDFHVFRQLWRWARKRHHSKGAQWLKEKYFINLGKRRWVFSAQQTRKGKRPAVLTLIQISRLPTRRHTKVRAEARFHDERHAEYFRMRRRREWQNSLWEKRQGQEQQQLELAFEP